jgi:hypothetical protein
LRWHLNTSLDRLYAQIWPTFLFLIFLALEAPEVHFSASPKVSPSRDHLCGQTVQVHRMPLWSEWRFGLFLGLEGAVWSLDFPRTIQGAG